MTVEERETGKIYKFVNLYTCKFDFVIASSVSNIDLGHVSAAESRPDIDQHQHHILKRNHSVTKRPAQRKS